MFDRILERMRTLVRSERYVLTLHAQEAMEDDELTIYDVVRCFLTGRIIDRQWDRRRREWKVAKIGPTLRLVILTVYRINEEVS